MSAMTHQMDQLGAGRRVDDSEAFAAGRLARRSPAGGLTPAAHHRGGHSLNGHEHIPADAARNYAVSPSACVSVILPSRYHEKYPWYLSCRSRRRQSCPSITRRQEAVLQRQVMCPS